MFYSYIHGMNQNHSTDILMKEILLLRKKLKENHVCVQHFANCALDSVEVSVITTDADGNIAYLNKKAEKIFNVRLNDIAGKHFTKAFKKSITENIKEEIPEKSGKGKSWKGDFEVYDQNGKVITLHSVDTPIFDENGKFKGMICVAYDMSEKKEAEKALIESEEKYRNVINNTIEGIFIIQDERIVYSNSRALDMMGYTEKEAFSKKFQEFISKDDLAKVIDNYKERLSGKKLAPYDIRLIKMDKEEIWVSLNVTLIKWNSQPALLCFITDISSRKQKEDELKSYTAT